MTFHKSSLYRTQRTEWKSIESKFPSFFIQAPNYPAAQYAAYIYTSGLLKNKEEIYFKTNLLGKLDYWKVKKGVSFSVRKRPLSWIKKILSWVPMFKKYQNTSKKSLLIQKKRPFFGKQKYKIEIPVALDLFDIPSLPCESIDFTLFEDPFTILATNYFQKWDPNFTPSNHCQNSHALFYREGQLQLGVPKESTVQERRKTLRLYQSFLLNLVGAHKLQLIQHRMKFDLEKMLEKKEPLYPEHIYRVNIGMATVEMEDIEKLYFRLVHLISQSDSIEIHSFESLKIAPFSMTGLEIKKLQKLTTSQALLKFLIQRFSKKPAAKVQYLSVECFNTLIDCLCPSSTEIEKAMTGRKIIHRAIMGFYTIGKKRRFKPWLDGQELLQMHEKLQKAPSWKSYFELLSHVVVKKHLIRRHPIYDWNVGALLPAPSFTNKSWYYVETWTDDGQGCFNYTLAPTCYAFKELPFIKLYRSTAADKYNMFSWRSISADLAASEAPGVLSPHLADDYELPSLFKFTLPLWVGYLLLAAKLKETLPSPTLKAHSLAFLLKYWNLLSQTLSLLSHRDKEKVMKAFPIEWIEEQFARKPKEINALEEKLFSLQRFLEDLSTEAKERVEDKVQRDLVFIGHSLGGAHAQSFSAHLLFEHRRMPLPGHEFICYASDSPATTQNHYHNFWNYLHEHDSLLLAHKSQIKLIIQFEYGDIVSQSGSVHLGSRPLHVSPPPKSLKTDLSIFKPLSSATALTITSPPTHGRRIGFAQEGKDYTLTPLSPDLLYEYNRAWLLGAKLREIFGFRLFLSPKVFEALRRAVAYSTEKVRHFIRDTYQKLDTPRGVELRDENGCAHVKYREDLEEKFLSLTEAIEPPRY